MRKIAKRISSRNGSTQSALTSLIARVQLVDDVDAALAANQTVLAVTGHQGLERILDLHFTDPQFWDFPRFLSQSKARLSFKGRARSLVSHVTPEALAVNRCNPLFSPHFYDERRALWIVNDRQKQF
jgi:hypothetical protein